MSSINLKTIPENKWIPYTYHISWSKQNIHYYGCEYSTYNKIANPHNLWKKYFTSSDFVKQYIEEYGDPDVIEIRKIFDNEKDCRDYEYKMLLKLRVVTNDKWLNKSYRKGYIAYGPANGFYGKHHTEETKEKLREWRKHNPITPMLGKHHTEETKRRVSEAKKGIPSTNGVSERNKNNKGKSFVELYGEEKAKKVIEKRSNSIRGSKRSEETKRKMSLIAKNRVKKECKYCRRFFPAGSYSYYHGEKCKLKTSFLCD